MNFYWSYTLLLKSLILMRLPKGAASTKLSDHLLKGFTTTYVAECLLAKPFTLQEKKRFVPLQLPTCTSGSICKQEHVWGERRPIYQLWDLAKPLESQ